MRVGGQLHALAAFTPGEETRYPRLSEPQGRSGWVRKISPPPGFNPRTVQHVATRCTDYAIPAHDRMWFLTLKCGAHGYHFHIRFMVYLMADVKVVFYIYIYV